MSKSGFINWDKTSKIKNEKLFNGNTKLYRWRQTVPELTSSNGYRATNIDCIWLNVEKKKLMIIEDKESGSQVQEWQKSVLTTIHNACLYIPGYQGLFVVEILGDEPEITEKTKVKINGQEVDYSALKTLYMFEDLPAKNDYGF